MEKDDVVEGVCVRCNYYKGILYIMTPDNGNNKPFMTIQCTRKDALVIEAVYNIEKEKGF